MQGTQLERFQSCYEDWVSKQKADLDELSETLDSLSSDAAPPGEAELRATVAKSMRLYEDYVERRRAMAAEDAPTLFCPSWCNSFERAFLWLGGCRPSNFIRFVYSLSSGAELEAQLIERAGDPRREAVGVVLLSAQQLELVNGLHARTLVEEEMLFSAMATLQEDVADAPLVTLVKKRSGREAQGEGGGAASNGVVFGYGSGGDGEVKEVMDRYAASLGGMLEAADGLRVSTVTELVVDILSPLQAVQLLVAARQLHLTLHEWGGLMDRHHRRA